MEDKIRHLCSVLSNVEWSGTLFYCISGSFDDGSLKATCLDICVMDVGSAGFTEFKDTTDIVSYRIDHPELLAPNVYEGLIHSHNNMPAFFSGTDMDTLKEEGNTLNHFLSLIVNNAGNYVARITRKVNVNALTKIKTECVGSSYYNTYGNEKVDLEVNKRSESVVEKATNEFYIEWFNMSIDKKEVVRPYDELDRRIKEIMNLKYRQKEIMQKKSELAGQNTYSSISAYNGDYKDVDSYKNYWERWKEEEKGEDSLEVVKLNGPLVSVESASPDVLKKMATQLLCGSILVREDKIDLVEWVNKMDDIYERRFGNIYIDENGELLGNWIDKLTEFVLGSCNDKKLEFRAHKKYGLDPDLDSEEFTEVYAVGLVKMLRKLPNSIVKDCIVDELTLYISKDAEKYL